MQLTNSATIVDFFPEAFIAESCEKKGIKTVVKRFVKRVTFRANGMKSYSTVLATDAEYEWASRIAKVLRLPVSTPTRCLLLSICLSTADALLSFHHRHRYLSFLMNRQELLETYIEEIIEGMDHKSMYQYVYDNLYDHLNKYDEEELIEEVKDYYPHLLEPSISELEATADDYGVGK